MLISASQRGHLRKKSSLYSVFIQLSTLCGHCQEMVNVGQRYHRTRSGHVGLQRLEHPIVYAWLHYKGFNSFFPRVYAAVLTFDLQLSWKTWWLCHDLGQQACSVWWPVCPESLSFPLWAAHTLSTRDSSACWKEGFVKRDEWLIE